MDEIINITVLNDISRSIIKYLARNLSLIFETDVKISRHIIVPTSLFNEEKRQYDGRKLLKFITENMTLKEVKTVNLAIFDRDLFTGSLDYVFSLASPFPKICVISLLRLHPHFEKDYFTGGLKKRKAGRFPLIVRRLSGPEKTLYYNRVLKEAVHGIGHTLGLTHCEYKDCTMHASNTVEDIDARHTGFCRNCMSLLN